MSDVINAEVGYLEPKYVDQIRNRLGVGVTASDIDFSNPSTLFQKMAALTKKLMANGTLKTILANQVYRSPQQTQEQLVANAVLDYESGGSKIPNSPVAALATIQAMIAGASNAWVTLVVVNLGDQSLELAEEPVEEHCSLGVQPAVMAGIDQLDPPNKIGGGTGPLKAWINSPIQAGLSRGWGSVGVWRFNHPTGSLYGACGSLRLTYQKYKMDVLIGGEWSLTTIFYTPINSYSAAFSASGTKSAKTFLDDSVVGKSFGNLIQTSLQSGKASFSITAGCENQKADDHVVVVIVDAQGT
jgi:hypothetical protein